MFRSAYCLQFSEDTKADVYTATKNFVDAVRDYKPTMLLKPKFHLLLHLADSMEAYGPTSSFNTERYI